MHAGDGTRVRYVDPGDPSMREWTAKEPGDELTVAVDVRGVSGATCDLVRAVDTSFGLTQYLWRVFGQRV
jgi:hypothetical protein